MSFYLYQIASVLQIINMILGTGFFRMGKEESFLIVRLWDITGYIVFIAWALRVKYRL